MAALDEDLKQKLASQYGLNLNAAGPVSLPAMAPPEATPMSALAPPQANPNAPAVPGLTSAATITPELRQLPSFDLSQAHEPPKASGVGAILPEASLNDRPAAAQPAYPPMAVIPGGWQPSSRVTKAGEYLDPAAYKELRKAQEEQAYQNQRAAIMGQQKAVEEASFATTQAQLAQRNAIEDADRQKARQAYIDSQMGHVKALQEQIGSGKVNPNELWESASTGSKVLAGIGLILGAFGSRNGQNAGMDAINQAIDRNIKTQQANIDNARSGVAQRVGLLGQMQALYKDQDQSLAATRIGLLEAAKAQMNAQLAKLSPQEAEIKGAQANAAFDEQIAQQHLVMQAKAVDQVTRSEVYRQPQVVGGGGLPHQQEQDADLFVPALGGFVRKSDKPEELRKTTAQNLQIQDNLNKLIALRREYDGWEQVKDVGNASKVANKMRSLLAATLPVVNVYKGQGAMSEGDKANAIESLANVMSKNPFYDPISVLQASRDLYSRDIDVMKQAYGVRSGTAQIVYDPRKGANVEAGQLTGKIATPAAPPTVKRTPIGGGS